MGFGAHVGFGPSTGFGAYAGQSSSGFIGTPNVQGQSSSTRPELQISYLGGGQFGSGFIRSFVHDFIAGGPQFSMSQQDDIDAY